MTSPGEEQEEEGKGDDGAVAIVCKSLGAASLLSCAAADALLSVGVVE